MTQELPEYPRPLVLIKKVNGSQSVHESHEELGTALASQGILYSNPPPSAFRTVWGLPCKCFETASTPPLGGTTDVKELGPA